jgi:uncharacterized protein
MEKKLQNLVDIIGEMGSLLVAYSGGVDSTLLLRVAKDVLGERVIAATAKSPTYPEREYEQARAMARILGVKHITVTTEELDHPEFFKNPPNRCYYCKMELFGQLRKLADHKGFNWVVDGTNCDDLNDFRPGMKAALEMAVRSPLKEAGLTKQEIRSLSKRMGIPTWNKPSLACLASRFPYGDRITPSGLQMVAEAEDYLHDLGFKQVRVRHHNSVARIEVPLEEMGRFYQAEFRHQVVERLKLIGYTYATLDLQGYRSGSMNEVLR